MLFLAHTNEAGCHFRPGRTCSFYSYHCEGVSASVAVNSASGVGLGWAGLPLGAPSPPRSAPPPPSRRRSPGFLVRLRGAGGEGRCSPAACAGGCQRRVERAAFPSAPRTLRRKGAAGWGREEGPEPPPPAHASAGAVSAARRAREAAERRRAAGPCRSRRAVLQVRGSGGAPSPSAAPPPPGPRRNALPAVGRGPAERPRRIGGNDLEPQPRPEEGKAGRRQTMSRRLCRPRRPGCVRAGRAAIPLSSPAGWGVSRRAGCGSGGGGWGAAGCGARPRGTPLPRPLRSGRGSSRSVPGGADAAGRGGIQVKKQCGGMAGPGRGRAACPGAGALRRAQHLPGGEGGLCGAVIPEGPGLPFPATARERRGKGLCWKLRADGEIKEGILFSD